jgi:transketolase
VKTWIEAQGSDSSAAPSREEIIQAIDARAREARRRSLALVAMSGKGHVGGDLSAAEILATLYTAVLRFDPNNPSAPARDRFVMSKGHSSAMLYATLDQGGFFETGLLETFMQPGSPLNGHPARGRAPGVEASTGPLGHGLPIAAGMAAAARLDRSKRRVYCLVGEGELQEGSNWEALMFASHNRLDNLTVIVDRNGLQQGASTEETNALEPLAAKAQAFGCDVSEVDGHDAEALFDLFCGLPGRTDRPAFVIANTHKGRGVSFMEDRVEWHHRVPTDPELAMALAELEETA